MQYEKIQQNIIRLLKKPVSLNRPWYYYPVRLLTLPIRIVIWPFRSLAMFAIAPITKSYIMDFFRKDKNKFDRGIKTMLANLDDHIKYELFIEEIDDIKKKNQYNTQKHRHNNSYTYYTQEQRNTILLSYNILDKDEDIKNACLKYTQEQRNRKRNRILFCMLYEFNEGIKNAFLKNNQTKIKQEIERRKHEHTEIKYKINSLFNNCKLIHKFNSRDPNNAYERNLVIYFGGNSEELYENLNEKNDVIQVGYPKGATSSQQLVDGGVSAVKRALAAGYKPENITIVGWSLGGAISAKVLERMKDDPSMKGEQKFARYVNYKSFTDIGSTIFQKPWLQKSINGLAWLLGVQLNAKKAIDSTLPVKEINAFYIDDDPIINQSIGKYLTEKCTTKVELEKTQDDEEECVEIHQNNSGNIAVFKLKPPKCTTSIQNHSSQHINLFNYQKIAEEVAQKKMNKILQLPQVVSPHTSASLWSTIAQQSERSQKRNSEVLLE